MFSFHESSPSAKITILTCGITFIASLPLLLCIKRIWFHPLSRYPGPKTWAASRIPYVLSLLRGNLNEEMLRMHEKYGDVVRLAPNEISFGIKDAWRDIYMHRPGHKECKKDPVWYLAPNNMPQNIITTTDVQVRARMRRLLTPSFNEQALRDQAATLEMYANRFLERIQAIYDTKEKDVKPVVINILDWINFFTMDIIGDLAIGESFQCLDGSSYHPWVKTLYNFFKGMIFAAAANFFPLTEFALRYMIPGHIKDKQRQHTEFTNTKILQRLELNSDRPDFITPFLRDMEKSPEKMSLGEIQSNFAIILVAGSETTATTLLGAFSKLASHIGTQERLWNDLNSRFKSVGDITVASTENIPYLDGVIQEALRTCYAVPGGFPRITPQGGDTYAGHYIPGGTSISIRPFVVLQSAKYFNHPHGFHPERWLPLEQRPSQFEEDELDASQPFNVGPTGCIGQPLAWAEMRLLLAKVIWSFKISMTEDKPFSWESLDKMMLVEKRPLWLEFERRIN